MGDIKPIGSEKLQGDDKMKRILELTYYNQKSTNSKPQNSNAELVKESTNGVYGIVREKDGYYVKKGLNESSLDYIGGLFMKNKNKFSSYAEAYKKLELLSSQEQLNEDVKKYVLNQNKAKTEVTAPQAAVDAMPPALPPADSSEPASDLPVDDMSADGPSPDAEEPMDTMDTSSEEGKRSDYMAEIQKYAGKLGQELRDQQPKMESDDIKYVLNMIISAVDLDILDEDDIEDIAKKFDRDIEDQEPTDDEMASDEEPASDEEAVPSPEDDLAERISKLEELVNTNFGDTKEEELDEYFFYDDEDFERRDKGLEPLSRRPDGTKIRPEDSEDEEYSKEVEFDITPELNDINESINTTLSKYFE